MRTGSGSKTGKMTVEQVRAFKAEMHDGETLRSKAKRYPVTESTLSSIRAGLVWADIEPTEEDYKNARANNKAF